MKSGTSIGAAARVAPDDADPHWGDDEQATMIEQGQLFGDEIPQPPGDDVGYRGPTACAAAGITYRQLDYWARTGLVAPSVRGASGSGSQRLYSFRDVLVLRVVRKLLEAGVSLQNIRAAVEHLRTRGVADLAHLTLISDGSTVYECTSDDEVIDLVRGGQGVFAIAVGRALEDMRGQLAELPCERPGQPAAAHPGDELAHRRRRRSSA
ncbi:MerR family transcriptional regulator [Frankia sp. CcI49]|uniref:MerR HTH family regulatory protein n=1 Tax=Parafrankia irregularis TaxID=795642 RepID=A0A0S4QV83_9ACTN|nr:MULTISPECIES: MerR family transcriptional regulator [Frankiaceae]EFC84352.1 transcriptional regulator, MerR family [Parafrankia sp. EUN1f]KPM55819.1 transcriptional regulator [Frankia sp. R43]MBE3201902.1 MerR family transcriptional regulator [Parafrankia sp. CH37]ONH58448.1 MerR family transcriptional regulator [Frankia sp. CcI49]CUU59511.1 MerR HTH family regulatory protein [Parafrankia irregularis]